jgi:hypothetical protein
VSGTLIVRDAVPAGGFVEVTHGTTTSLSGCAWGYLADA